MEAHNRRKKRVVLSLPKGSLKLHHYLTGFVLAILLWPLALAIVIYEDYFFKDPSL